MEREYMVKYLHQEKDQRSATHLLLLQLLEQRLLVDRSVLSALLNHRGHNSQLLLLLLL